MDQIANMLIKIKNAGLAKKGETSVPFSKFKLAIAEGLVRAGYLAACGKREVNQKTILLLSLAYEGKNHKINDLKRLSKLSRRQYVAVKELGKYKHGRGAYFLSTPKGVLSDKEARLAHVGGEILFSIW